MEAYPTFRRDDDDENATEEGEAGAEGYYVERSSSSRHPTTSGSSSHHRPIPHIMRDTITATAATPPRPTHPVAPDDGARSSSIVVVASRVRIDTDTDIGIDANDEPPPSAGPRIDIARRRRRSLRLKERHATSFPSSFDDAAAAAAGGGVEYDDDDGISPPDYYHDEDGTMIATTSTSTGSSDARDSVAKLKPPGNEESSSSSSSSSSSARDDKENSSNGRRRDAATKGRKVRRDTFDLSRRRGRRIGVGKKRRPAGATDLGIPVPRDGGDDDNNDDDDDDLAVMAPSNDGADYVTPKAGSVEVNVGEMVDRMTRAFDDDDVMGSTEEEERRGHRRRRRRCGDDDHGCDEDAMIADVNGECWARDDNDDDDDSMAIITKCNANNLTSAAIEVRMTDLFPERMRHVHRHPCVSARIFAAMSAIYSDQSNFAPLLPLLVALVDAEIVSLTSKDDRNEVLFINRRVCFSGFDCSSTTTAVGAVVGQGGGDLGPSVEALEVVLRAALELSRPVHYLDIAIRCLRCMSSSHDVSDACARTMVGYYPSARFRGAMSHYMNELMDVKCFLASQRDSRRASMHVGVRYRLNDFIGRTIRYHLRESLNTIPTSAVDFNVDKCIERWGRAVDDRSISSILNFALERVHDLVTTQSEIFYRGDQMPIFFAGEASTRVHSLSRDELKRIDKSTFESLVTDVVEARSFLSGARASKFVVDLLSCSAVREHVDASGGWVPVEAMASTFYKLNLHEGSENGHLVQLRDVQDLLHMVKDFVLRAEGTVEQCELCVRRLQGKLNFKTKSTFIRDLKLHLAEEKGEYFPLVVVPRDIC